MAQRWQLTVGHALRLRYWDDECVVHHLGSNHTHRLAAWAGQLLEDLRDGGAQATETLAARFDGMAPEELEQTLMELARLALVERLP